jgi:lysylphosphatidylglycerol synthetase-like protein (DUF2156 family)
LLTAAANTCYRLRALGVAIERPTGPTSTHSTQVDRQSLQRDRAILKTEGGALRAEATMAEAPVKSAKFRARDRVVVNVDSLAARWIGALALFSALCWLISLLAREHHYANWHAAGRIAWSVTILAAVAFIARGIFLGRPVTAAHASVAVVMLLAGLGAHVVSMDLLGNLLIAGAGWVFMWPTTVRPQPEALPRVWAVVNATSGDPLAPFAMQARKSYHFNADRTAAIGYCTRIGFAVVSGDPLGDETRFPELVADFAAMCHTRGWRIIVLGCSERRLRLWSDPAVIGQSMSRVPIGRDVVIHVGGFDMTGRKFRNLRQAVQRTHNFGITTEVIAEQDLDDSLQAELAEVLYSSHSGARFERGFSMFLDGVLERRYPGVQLIVARDQWGRVQGFHRYAVAGGGTDVTLDVPWRRPGAPNGIDERLSIDMASHSKTVGGQRLSISFAAFADIFANRNRTRLQNVVYVMIHLLDPFIALESLYRYVRKFHSLAEQRYALLSIQHLPAAVLILLSLELVPHRRRLSVRQGV